MTTRACKNHNPGNLIDGVSWYGILPRADMNPDQLAETRFAVFKSDILGFRALGVLLLNYQKIHDLYTTREIISRFAPPNENNTDAYISSVCQFISHGPDDLVDLHNPDGLAAFMKAIAIHESGGWFFDDRDLSIGVKMALEAVTE